MFENKNFTQVYIRKDTKRELEIMATLKAISMRNLVEEAIELYKIKYRLTDRVEDFKRG